MRLFGRRGSSAVKAGAPDEAATQDPAPAPARGRQPKGAPTPTRKEALAARQAAMRPDKKELRRRTTERRRAEREAELARREADPAKVLLRNMIDARFNVIEIILPLVVVMFIANIAFARNAFLSSLVLALVLSFMLVGVLDHVLLQRRFQRTWAARHPSAPKPRGLAMYGFNRAMYLRFMRMPKPVVKRGEKV